MATVTLGDVPIVYSVEVRPRRKHLAIQIVAQNQIAVLIPSSFDRAEVESWLKREAQWVLRQVQNHAPGGLLPARRFETGDPFWFQGRLLRLSFRYRSDSESLVTIIDDHLEIRLPALGRDQVLPDLIRNCLLGWYADQAQSLLPTRVELYAPIVGAWPTQIKIASYKSRWGSCSHDGKITFNWRIIQAPLPMVDYVVVHELAHRYHWGHGPAFWKAVQAVLPDAAARRLWFHQHGPDLDW